ncbi:hypothetical protein RDV89_12115 [Nocardioides zeae]|uniref:Uncharacterized protein n=1 Tax=Nocardioides imazamoxiresistens TaxID=3231893 RepID=A0ABU3PX55_9ACTN|nr:hypothetical protein [Nocardioides zeae]MDT9593818.1 hypothetical protein [Nocardioides zeae]
MTRSPQTRAAYADPSAPADLVEDCRIARAALQPAPSLAYADRPRETPKPTIDISAAAARIARAVYQD